MLKAEMGLDTGTGQCPRAFSVSELLLSSHSAGSTEDKDGKGHPG